MLTTPEEKHEFGIFTLNVTEHRLLCGQELRPLAPKPFEVLTFMARNPNRVIEKDELINFVWGNEHSGGEEPLVKYINAVRKALNDEERKKIVETVPTLGYRFNPGNAPATSESIGMEDSLDEAALASTNVRETLSIGVESSPHPIQVISDETSTNLTLRDPETDQRMMASGHIRDTKSVDGAGVTTLSLEDESSEFEEHQRLESLSNKDETDFVDWIDGPGMRLTLTLFGLAMVLTPVLSIYVAIGWTETAAMKAASWAQFIVILFVLGHSWFKNPRREFRAIVECRKADVIAAGFKSKDDLEQDCPVLQCELQTYTRRWRLLLASWVPLYILFAIADLRLVKYQIAQVILNILNTWMILLCFNSLNKDADEQSGQHLSDLILGYILFGLLLVAVTVVILFQKYEAATSLTGIAAGVFMALYVGRLQSKFMGPRIWILYLFYSYTAIQPMVLYFQTHPRWGIVILDFALILKSLLYLYVTWLFQSGLLLFYFARMKRTSAGIKKQRAAFRRLLK